MKKLLSVGWLLIFLLACGANSINTHVVMKVKDGDTLEAVNLKTREKITCRLYGIDAPELGTKKKPGQPFGEEALRELKKLVLGQEVKVSVLNQDQYGRKVCVIEKDGENINLKMVRGGLAWAYVEYLKRPHASEFLEVENESRQNNCGIWTQTNPTPPWEFRKLQKTK